MSGDSQRDRSSAPRASAERMLAVRDHGREELRRKLLKRGFDSSEVDSVLDALQAEGLLDEARTAREFVRQTLEKGHGAAYIRAKLFARGLSPQGAPFTPAEEAASLRAFLERRRLKLAALTGAAERAKMLRFLRGRGYSGAAIGKVLGAGVDGEEE